ncbi:MAG TPA: type I secretion system permease/ATPase [Hyphomicrobiaceae bacterium]|nr:type I secretion system permease/ATPase [Hyphomicrobiaceae bacterium]
MIPDLKDGSNEVVAALKKQSTILATVGLFSGVLNVLALTGAFYMLQIYDRVLPSGSVATLIGLSILMAGLYGAFGLLDYVRMRLLGRVGLRFDQLLSDRIFSLVHARASPAQRSDPSLQPIRDLDQIRTFLSGMGPAALFDVPWMPLFLIIIYLLHPVLGLFALAGAIVLVVIAALAELMAKAPITAAASSYRKRLALAEAARRNGEAIQALGMGTHLGRQWATANARYLTQQARAADVTSLLGTLSKIIRLLLQSGMLGLGAYYAISGDVSPGTIIAGSITMSRAMAPLDSVIAHWRGFISARQCFHRLIALFRAQARAEKSGKRTSLPAPQRTLQVSQLFITPPGARHPALRNINFSLNAGDGLGIIGPTASGKSSLARALVGVWPASNPASAVRLDEAELDQWPKDELGRHIGYLPQDIELFDGTVADNICRFDPRCADDEIIAAATAAGCHEMVVRLEDGYQTRIGEGGASLSGGQRQRIALARTLFRVPFLVVLDEPNANLDQRGESALSQAIIGIRRRGGIAVVVAHRPSTLASLNKILVIANGQVQDFGPRDDVLRRVLKSQTAGSGAPGQEAHAPAATKALAADAREVADG